MNPSSDEGKFRYGHKHLHCCYLNSEGAIIESWAIRKYSLIIIILTIVCFRDPSEREDGSVIAEPSKTEKNRASVSCLPTTQRREREHTYYIDGPAHMTPNSRHAAVGRDEPVINTIFVNNNISSCKK